jgi:cytochrome c-type biogenesis protein CcmE
MKRFIAIVFVTIVLAVSMVYFATNSTAASVYFPSELLAHTNSAPLKRVKVGGRVTAAAPIDYRVEPKLVLRFSIVDPPKQAGSADEATPDPTLEASKIAIPVVYEGLKPDMFAAGRDVIVEGSYENGVLIAKNLLTQCPSKYEPPSVPQPGNALH